MTNVIKRYTEEPLLRGHPDKRPPFLERPLDSVNLNIKVLISTPDERPPLLKGHFSCVKGMVSQEGFHCRLFFKGIYLKIQLLLYFDKVLRCLNMCHMYMPRECVHEFVYHYVTCMHNLSSVFQD